VNSVRGELAGKREGASSVRSARGLSAYCENSKYVIGPAMNTLPVGLPHSQAVPLYGNVFPIKHEHREPQPAHGAREIYLLKTYANASSLARSAALLVPAPTT